MNNVNWLKKLEVTMNEIIYMDNAATTSVNKNVLDAMLPYFTDMYGNASSIYRFAGESTKAVDEARTIVADFIGAKTKEIYFTGGGSESDNWVLISVAEQYAGKGKHIITSKIEHHAVLHTCEYLEKRGYEITYIDVDENGVIDIKQLEDSIREDTILISVMYANNEIGTIQPIKEIGEIAHKRGIIFHTDAVQAYGHEKIDVNEQNIDMLSASGHKFNGPKGIGILYVRENIRIGSFIHGGGQERGKRAGTHNTPGIVGFAKATEIAASKLDERKNKEIELRDYLIKSVLDTIPYTKLNGHKTDRLANNINFSFRFIEGESLLMMLDQEGICGSSGSACTSGSLDPSHVLLAIGLPHEIAHGSLRLTISEENTIEEIDYVVEKLKLIVERLRNLSPLYEDFVKNNKQ